MRVALPHRDGFIYKHFSTAKEFKIYLIEDGEVKASQVIPSTGLTAVYTGIMLRDLKIDAVICSNISEGAMNVLEALKIELYPGIIGVADLRAEQLAQGKLITHPELGCGIDEDSEGSFDCGGDCSSCGTDCDCRK